MEYDVTCGENVVGRVNVTKEGLYTRFQCICNLPDDGVYRALMICGNQKTDLGICVPNQSQFAVNKRLQSKCIPDGEMAFVIVPASQTDSRRFIPVSSGMPFDCISALAHARLCNRNGSYGILIEDQLISK